MSKVYFYHSTMNSGKSASCLININQYRSNDINVLVAVPAIMGHSINTRFGDIEVPATPIQEGQLVSELFHPNIHNVIIIDEVQFLSIAQIEDLFQLNIKHKIPVICYGLLTDFHTHLFEGSKRLIELGAKLQKIKSVGLLGGMPVVNARVDADGKVITEGSLIQLGREESYKAMTLKEYWENCNHLYD